MRKTAIIAAAIVGLFFGCGGTETQGKPTLATVAEQANIGVDSVDVFSQTANVMIKVPYSKLIVESGPIDGRLEVVGTANGAIAALFTYSIDWGGVAREDREPPEVGDEPLEVELDKDEWYTFFNVLYNSGIRRWKREYRSPNFGDVYSWRICIYTKDRDTLIYSFGIDAYPPNKDEWSAFRDIIDNFIEMMKEKKQKLREMEYSKRFGRPMSGYERSIKEISYNSGTTKPIIVEIKTSGEVVLFNRCSVRLNIEDWLDIINAVNNIVDESIKKNNVDTVNMKSPMWGRVTAYDSISLQNQNNYFYDRLGCSGRYDGDKINIDKCKDSLSYNKPVDFPVSDGLKKIMDDIMAKIMCERE